MRSYFCWSYWNLWHYFSLVFGKFLFTWNNTIHYFFRRKSISGNWKSCVGSAMLEETEVLERYKFWLDSVAELFGGLDMLALEVVVSKDGLESIIGINDSALSLLGNQQEEDRKYIFDLIMEKLEVHKFFF